MKNLTGTLCAFLMLTLLLTACRDDDEASSEAPSPEEFQTLRQTALDNITQTFEVDFSNGATSFTSEQGVRLDVFSCTDASGNQSTSFTDVNLKFMEIFDRGTMLVTNRPTVGISPSGEEGILISGGEFFLDATQNGEQLNACAINARIPTDLTGGTDFNMSLWTGDIDANGDLTWVTDSTSGIEMDTSTYFVFMNQFGWINCDVFWDDPRPRTGVTVETPTNYDETNSAVYFSIVGENSGLGRGTGQFPIGQEAHFIFVTVEDDDWRYAVQSVTISENEVVTFNLDDTTIATESELVGVINGLP